MAKTRWEMTVRAPDPAEALTLAVSALRQAMGMDARAGDVAAMEATVKPAAASGRAAPLTRNSDEGDQDLGPEVLVRHSRAGLSPVYGVPH